jgi:hypothetical protein
MDGTDGDLALRGARRLDPVWARPGKSGQDDSGWTAAESRPIDECLAGGGGCRAAGIPATQLPPRRLAS